MAQSPMPQFPAPLSSGRYVGVRLRLEMPKRGVPEELVDEQLGRISQEHDEDEQARQLLARHFPGFFFVEAGDGEKGRVARYLQRRGSLLPRYLPPISGLSLSPCCFPTQGSPQRDIQKNLRWCRCRRTGRRA